ncbi:hypothetical protein N184_12345 [Sinorhizobium sp. GL28]|nr:hypothetical protein N184_12345 [Sinorhizobium sp. GL28]
MLIRMAGLRMALSMVEVMLERVREAREGHLMAP